MAGRSLAVRAPGMRGYTIIATFVVSVPLAGCYGVTVPKPLPDWAMHQGAQTSERLVAKPRRPIAPQREHVLKGAPNRTEDVAARAVSPIDRRPAAAPPRMAPYTPEWQAREEALDNQLRRRMHICNGC